jgi:hypothetical protein
MLCAYPTGNVIVALNISYFTILIWEWTYPLSPSDDETEVKPYFILSAYEFNIKLKVLYFHVSVS